MVFTDSIVQEPNFYTVNFSTPGNGSISGTVGEGSITSGESVEEGSQVDFMATPNSGYQVDDWLVNGEPIGSTSTTYTISSLEDDVTVEVQFEVIPTTTNRRRNNTTPTVEVVEEEVPLGNGNPEAFVIIEPDIVPLGIIDYSMPYIIGYPDKTFRPEREVTRAEMAAIFARILSMDVSNPGEAMYDDVSEDEWYYSYIQGVTRVGLFNGYGDNIFKPDQPVTHAEIAIAFSKYWELRGIEIETNDDSYTDIEGHPAQEMINRLYNAGISVSYGDGTFKPDAFTTRTELVVMVNRSLNRAEMVRVEPTFLDVVKSFWGFGAIEAASGYQEPESAQLIE